MDEIELTEMDDNVRQFGGATALLPDNPLAITPRRVGWCRHDAVTLDEHTRTVTCANPQCGAVLDPFDFLVSNGNTIQRAWSAYKHTMQQVHEIAERLSILKKEEKRLRAMVKRLHEKVPVLNTRSHDL